MNTDDLILVAGGGGFIGGHLVRRPARAGLHERPRGRRQAARRVVPALRRRRQPAARPRRPRRLRARRSTASRHVYNLAADMGGMGFIENNKAACMLSVLINTHLLHGRARRRRRALLLRLVGVRLRRRHASTTPTSTALREEDAYPAMPEDGYGWEKLFTRADVPALPRGLRPARRASRATTTSTARTAPTTAAARRRRPRSAARSIEAKLVRRRTRSRSGATASRRAASCTSTTASTARSCSWTSDVDEPINLGSDRAGHDQPARRHRRGDRRRSGCTRRYDLDAPQGVRGRNSDNTLIKSALGWAPSITLEDGLEQTYAWIYDQIATA